MRLQNEGTARGIQLSSNKTAAQAHSNALPSDRGMRRVAGGKRPREGMAKLLPTMQ